MRPAHNPLPTITAKVQGPVTLCFFIVLCKAYGAVVSTPQNIKIQRIYSTLVGTSRRNWTAEKSTAHAMSAQEPAVVHLLVGDCSPRSLPSPSSVQRTFDLARRAESGRFLFP